jgi:ABC-type nitrate/sulfonate/bicarbonate transport system ATPase subunit
VEATINIESIIEVKGLTKSYNGLLVLNNISFNVKKGEILSILGPSGSGKTTLLRCLIGLEKFNSSVDSIKINSINRNEYLNQKRIAFVPQRYSNYPWLNVFENIELGMVNHENDVFLKENVSAIIEAVGLSGFEKYTIDKLSGGMQQRVAIGRAIAQNTDIIAFDEPFGALDFKIREKLQLLVKQLDKTILFVTHDIEEALFIADELIMLSRIPTTITNAYKLPFRSNMDASLKFEQEFVNLRKEIQFNLPNGNDNSIK